MTTEPPSALRTSSARGTGSLGSGVLAYVFFAIVTRALGAADAAPVAVLWSWWGFAGAGLTFPLQHWIAHSVTLHEGEGAVRRALPAVTLLVLGIAAVVTVTSGLARDPLFHDGGLAFPLLAGAVTVGAGVLGVVRGVLTARRRFLAVAVGLVMENGVRCVAAVALIAADVHNPTAYGACLVVGYFAVFLWPAALRLGRFGNSMPADSPLAFLSGASAGQVLAQAVLAGGPVLLAAANGAPAEVTALFAALALFRAPYILALGRVAQLTERLTRLVVAREHRALRRFSLGVIAATLVTAVAAGAFGAVAGPPLTELVFGSGVRLTGGNTASVAVGSTFALANLVLAVSVLAHGWPRAVVASWLGALLPGGVFFLVGSLGGSVLDATCSAFVFTEGSAFFGLSAISVGLARRQKHRRPER